MIENEFIIVGVIAFLIGMAITYLFFKRVDPIKFTKDYKDIQKVIQNPEVLVERLNANGKLIDIDEEIKCSVIEEDGVKKLKIEKIPAPQDQKKLSTNSPQNPKKSKSKNKR